MSISRPSICLITNSLQYPTSPLDRQFSAIGRAIEAGCDFIQIREKHLPRRELLDFSLSAVSLARGTSTRIIVNRDYEVALEAGAWGVHLNTNQAFPQDRGGLFIGASTHSYDEARRAEAAGADYVFLGPVFPPLSKTAPDVLGIESFRSAVAQLQAPVFALGGITPERARKAVEAGAAGIAGIGLFADPDTIARTMVDLRRMMEEGAGSWSR